jgi:hypothetical protein
MAANLESVGTIADSLVNAADLTLSGPVLSELLLSLDLVPMSAPLVTPLPSIGSTHSGQAR